MDYHGVYCTLVIWPVAGAQAGLFPNETPQNRYARSVKDKLKIVYILGWCNVAGVAKIASHRVPDGLTIRLGCLMSGYLRRCYLDGL